MSPLSVLGFVALDFVVLGFFALSFFVLNSVISNTKEIIHETGTFYNIKILIDRVQALSILRPPLLKWELEIHSILVPLK